MDQEVVAPNQVAVTTRPSEYNFGSPPPVSSTTVIVQQPSPMLQMGPRMWSSGMCACFDDMGSCLLGTFCPLILACKLSGDMGESACVPCCVPGSIIALRTKMRTQNNILGSIMDDCCMAQFCGPCIMCQMSRELDYIRTMQQ